MELFLHLILSLASVSVLAEYRASAGNCWESDSTKGIFGKGGAGGQLTDSLADASLLGELFSKPQNCLLILLTKTEKKSIKN